MKFAAALFTLSTVALFAACGDDNVSGEETDCIVVVGERQYCRDDCPGIAMYCIDGEECRTCPEEDRDGRGCFFDGVLLECHLECIGAPPEHCPNI